MTRGELGVPTSSGWERSHIRQRERVEANRGGGYVGDCGGGSCDHEDNYKLQLEDEPWTGSFA